MATLVLTTVGGAIGGPIGAALGAMLGQQADRALFAPRTARQGPRLSELAVQTSSYGNAIPRVFGTLRVAGQVIWSTDLIESRSTARGGKGQPGVTSYSYAASFAVLLSARRVSRVGRIWADGKLLRGAAGDWKSTCGGFRLHVGTEDQTPDPLIASAVGIGATPAHRGCAYAVFEQLQLADFGNRIPSLTFELTADEDAPTIGAVAAELGQGAITGAGPGDTIDGFAASGDSIGGALSVLAQAAGAQFVPHGEAMRLARAGGAPAMIVPADARLSEQRAAAGRHAAVMRVAYHDPARDWQTGVQQSAGASGGDGSHAGMLELPAAVSAARARAIADDLAARQANERRTRRVTLDHGVAASPDARPGATIGFAGEAQRWRVTRTTIDTTGVVLDLCPVTDAAGERTADAGAGLPAPDLVAGRTRIEIFELPPLDDQMATVPQIAVAAAGEGPGWRGAALLTSRDGGGSWQEAGGTAMPATMGRLVEPLWRAPETLADAGGAIVVELLHEAMTLESVNAMLLDRGANLALVGDELIQFAGVTPIAPRRWRLRTLWRGRRGTTPAAHVAGERFVLIEEAALRRLMLPDLRVGEEIVVRAAGSGDGDLFTTATMVPGGVSIAPPAPVGLRVSASDAGGAVLRWTRRSRTGWRWIDSVDVPLGEELERYRIDSVARSIVVDTPALPLTTAELAGGPIRVTQIGTVAASAPATIIL